MLQEVSLIQFQDLNPITDAELPQTELDLRAAHLVTEIRVATALVDIGDWMKSASLEKPGSPTVYALSVGAGYLLLRHVGEIAGPEPKPESWSLGLAGANPEDSRLFEVEDAKELFQKIELLYDIKTRAKELVTECEALSWGSVVDSEKTGVTLHSLYQIDGNQVIILNKRFYDPQIDSEKAGEGDLVEPEFWITQCNFEDFDPTAGVKVGVALVSRDAEEAYDDLVARRLQAGVRELC